MFREKFTGDLNGMHNPLGELSLSKKVAQLRGDAFPKQITAFGVNRRVANDRENLRRRSHEDQNRVAVFCLVHLQLLEADGCRCQRIFDATMADEYPNLAGGMLFGMRDCRYDFVVIQSIEEVLCFHGSPTPPGAASAEASATPRESPAARRSAAGPAAARS